MLSLIYRDSYTLFKHNIIIEFDKMQIPFMMILWLHLFSRKVSLAQSEFAFFGALTAVDALFIFVFGGKINVKQKRCTRQS